MHKAAVCLLLGLSACARRADNEQDKDKDEVVYVKSEDPGMTAAIAKARATLEGFKTALGERKPGTERYAVKVGFPYGDGDREHIWVKDPVFAQDKVSGRVMNQPVDVQNIKLGQRVSAPAEDISDWMYVEGGVLRGGYTMRVLLEKMAPDEQQKMLGELGVRLE